MSEYVSKGIAVSFSTLQGDLIDVNQSAEKVDTVDSTHQTSTWRDFLASFMDGGEWTLAIAFDPDQAQPAVGTSGTLLVTWPTGATKKYKATAILTGKSLAGAMGQKLVMTFSFKITGEPNWYY